MLSYLGRSLVMLTSVFGMALALWVARNTTLPSQVAAVIVGPLVASVGAEVVHVAYHSYEAARGLGDPPHGGFFTSAVLVGLINCAAMGPAMSLPALRRRWKRTP